LDKAPPGQLTSIEQCVGIDSEARHRVQELIA
jgi:hypothetical protein